MNDDFTFVQAMLTVLVFLFWGAMFVGIIWRSVVLYGWPVVLGVAGGLIVFLLLSTFVWWVGNDH